MSLIGGLLGLDPSGDRRRSVATHGGLADAKRLVDQPARAVTGKPLTLIELEAVGAYSSEIVGERCFQCFGVARLLGCSPSPDQTVKLGKNFRLWHRLS